MSSLSFLGNAVPVPVHSKRSATKYSTSELKHLVCRWDLFLTITVQTQYQACSSGLLCALFPSFVSRIQVNHALSLRVAFLQPLLTLIPARKPRDEKSAPWIVKGILVEAYCLAINFPTYLRTRVRSSGCKLVPDTLQEWHPLREKPRRRDCSPA